MFTDWVSFVILAFREALFLIVHLKYNDWKNLHACCFSTTERENAAWKIAKYLKWKGDIQNEGILKLLIFGLVFQYCVVQKKKI